MKRAEAEHVVVYRDEQYFSAWPFNGGFWQFADGELVVGFVRGRVDYAKPETVGHSQVDVDNGEQVTLRSTDGGRTWPLETMNIVYTRPAFDEVTGNLQAALLPEQPPLDPTADGYCLLSGYGIPIRDKYPHVAWVMVSTDRAKTWLDPVRVPHYRFAYMGGRPSYLVREDGMLLLFIHAARTPDPTGNQATSPVAVPIIMGSPNGGRTWGVISEVPMTPERPAGIMPYPLQLPNGRILIAVRRQYQGTGGTPGAYTQIYCSDDGARTWAFLSRVNDWGAPANLVQLDDGRIVCVYGYRQPAFGIRARVSEDGGSTWGEEIVLRDDGGTWDLGYPRTHLRSDGSLVTVYYFNDKTDPIQCGGGVRYIATTIWSI